MPRNPRMGSYEMGRQLRYDSEVTKSAPDELPGEPEERLLEVVVRFCGDLEILKILLPVERHRSRLDFPFLPNMHHLLSIHFDDTKGKGAYLDVNFVTTQDDRDVLAHPFEVTMPIGDVLVRDPGRDVEHDDPALSLDVIPIPQSTELFLSSGVPDVEADGAVVGVERERVDFDSQGGCTRRGYESLGGGVKTYRCTSSQTPL